jgi:hypothetical protein
MRTRSGFCSAHPADALREQSALIASIAKERLWLNELIANPTISFGDIAERERCSVRKVNMTISLAFLAPDVVKAAVEGRLPYGMGVARLLICPQNGRPNTEPWASSKQNTLPKPTALWTIRRMRQR